MTQHTPDLSRMSDNELYGYTLHQQGIQKRNPPDSEAWKLASKKIHAAVAENTRRYGPKAEDR